MEEILKQIDEIANMSDRECELFEEDYIEHRQQVREFLEGLGFKFE